LKSRTSVFAWSLVFAAATLIILAHALEALNGRLTASEWLSEAFLAIFALTCTTLGALIAAREPENAIGWIFCAVGLLQAMNFVGDAYSHYAVVARTGTLPGGALAAWFTEWNWIPSVALLATFLPLLFPNGKLPSARWRWVARVTAGAIVVVVGASAVGLWPERYDLAQGRAVSEEASGPLGLLFLVSFPLLFLGMLASVAAVVLRFRRSKGEERQQLRWFAFAAALLAVGLMITFSPLSSFVPEFVVFPSLLTLPIAAGIAILKYRLYEIDVVIRKTIVFAILAVLIMVVSLGTLLALSTPLTGTAADETRVVGIAGVVVGVLVWPLWKLSRRIADRLVFGGRASPYEVLTEFADRVGDSYSAEDVLPRMAQVLSQATGAEIARVWLQVGGKLRPEAAWPADAPPAAAVGITRGALSGLDPEHATEVRHQGEVLGALSVMMPASDPMNPSKGKLVRDLAAQAGPVLRNVRLLEDLRESRRRIVATQDARAKQLERNIHDGAQQQLVALAVKLRLAEGLAERDPAKTRAMLNELQSEATSALEDLRDLAHGIYPPLLADKGLTSALVSQIRKAAIPVELEASIGRYPPETEAAVYFCCLEALQNVSKYANATHVAVRLSDREGLTFEVSDNGSGFDPTSTGYGTGLQGMADRLDAIGGTLQVQSAPGEGTSVTGRVSVGPA
jgi:signal transduction histidine kinase